MAQSGLVSLNRMRRKFLCGLAATLGALPLRAQPVPARDLWEFPLGAILQPAALSADPAVGLWNPAVHSLAPNEQLRVGVTSLSATSQQGVDGQIAALVWRRPNNGTLGVSIARSSIDGIVRTEFDPQALGNIPYNTLLLSVSATRELLPQVTIGLAARWREGRVDDVVRSALAADFGVIIRDFPLRDTRIAVSSFLWRPGREIEDRPAILAAVDGVVFRDAARTHEFRAGYSFNGVNRGTRESGPYLLARIDRLEGNIAVMASSVAGRRVTRIRSGLALRYARYIVGVGREEGISGLGPLYQFTLSSMLR